MEGSSVAISSGKRDIRISLSLEKMFDQVCLQLVKEEEAGTYILRRGLFY